ncbi:PAS domain S-box protein, partial [Leptolyngbya sp. FACHB-36]|uniref:PAS domain-containing protein n=1 Tax=Leptolyngbya sp. FACHB-36 TaxID=2692808 RepID=UPI001680D945
MRKKNWLKRLYRQGILISLFLIFTVPFGVVVQQLTDEIGISVEFAQRERSGLRYNYRLRVFLEQLIQQHQLFFSYYQGESSFKPDLLKKQADIAAAVKAVDAVDRDLGATLKTTAKWQKIRQSSQTLSNNLLTLSPDSSLSLHASLISDVRSLIADVGDASNLILDPDLGSYYLMDGVVTKIPSMIEQSVQVMTLGTTIVKRSPTTQEKVRLLSASNAIQSNLNAIQRGTGVAFAANPDLKPAIEPFIADSEISAKELLKLIRITSFQIREVGSLEFAQIGDWAITDQFKLYDTFSPVLDRLLQARADRFTEKQQRVRGFAVLIFIALLGVVVLLLRNQMQRRNTEMTLREQENLLHMAMNAAHMGAWEWNLATSEGKWSNEVVGLFGLDPETFSGDSEAFNERVHPDDRVLNEQAVQQVLKSGGEYRTEYRTIWEDGSVHWLTSVGSLVRNKPGQPLLLTGVTMDITDRKSAEAAIQQAEEKYRSIFENAVDGIFQTTPAGHFLSANPALARIYGYDSPGELIASLSHQIDHELYVDPDRR